MNKSLPKQLLRGPIRPGRKLLNRALHRFECRGAGRREADLAHPPVFILGAPRCGSTLLYQIMLDHFDLGYISNFHCLFYGAPSLVERLVRPGRWKRPYGFESRHGKVSGWNAPSECGEYWYRFFRRHPHYVPLSAMNEVSLRDLRASMRAIVGTMGKPILFKNLLCALRLGPMIRALPESLFIVVQRDWAETAHSILEARRKLYGNYEEWFSAQPPEVEELKRRPSYEQAVEQIRSIHRLIDEARASAPPARFIDVDYGDLCGDTYATLDRLAAFFESNRVGVARGGSVPSSFDIKGGVRIDEDLYRKIKRYLAENPRT
jgi:hypothetical protein